MRCGVHAQKFVMHLEDTLFNLPRDVFCNRLKIYQIAFHGKSEWVLPEWRKASFSYELKLNICYFREYDSATLFSSIKLSMVSKILWCTTYGANLHTHRAKVSRLWTAQKISSGTWGSSFVCKFVVVVIILINKLIIVPQLFIYAFFLVYIKWKLSVCILNVGMANGKQRGKIIHINVITAPTKLHSRNW